MRMIDGSTGVLCQLTDREEHSLAISIFTILSSIAIRPKPEWLIEYYWYQRCQYGAVLEWTTLGSTLDLIDEYNRRGFNVPVPEFEVDDRCMAGDSFNVRSFTRIIWRDHWETFRSKLRYQSDIYRTFIGDAAGKEERDIKRNARVLIESAVRRENRFVEECVRVADDNPTWSDDDVILYVSDYLTRGLHGIPEELHNAFNKAINMEDNNHG